MCAASRTAALTTLLTGDVLLVLVVRAGREPFWRVGLRGNRAVVPVVAATLLLVFAALFVPPMRDLLDLAAVDPSTTAIAFGAAIVATVWPGFVAEWRARRRHPGAG